MSAHLVRGWGGVLLLAASLGGCHSEPLVTVDSNTNWLRCEASSTCGGTESCVCGVCAGPCDAVDCAARGGICAPATEQRCVTQAVDSGGVCLPKDISGGWSATASSSNIMNQPGDLLYNPPENALDGDLKTRWSSGKPQAGDEWFQLDLGQSLDVRAIELDVGDDASVQSYMDYARGYFVSVSDSPADLHAQVLASGAGEAPVTHVDLNATGQFVLIRQTGQATNWWSIHELRADVLWPAP
jgi:hypothetical protein